MLTLSFTTLVQNLGYYTYTTPTSADTSSMGSGPSPIAMVIYFAVLVLVLAAVWRVFKKANRPGWAAIVPVYNQLQVLWLVGRPWWWLLLMLIPIVNIVLAVIVLNDLAKSFGKGTGMTVLLFFLPFVGYPILGFGDAVYKGPAALKITGIDTTPPPADKDAQTPSAPVA